MVTKWKNTYNHKIFTRINQNESKYGNKYGCENIIIYHHKICTIWNILRANMVTKWENSYNHKIYTRLKENKSKYGNKFGCELEANLNADQCHIFYKLETNWQQICSGNEIKNVAYWDW